MVVENLASVRAVGLAVRVRVRTFYSMDLTPLSLMILAVESCEVIVDASVVALAPLKLMLAKVQPVVRRDEGDCSDLDLPGDWSSAIAGDVRMHHLMMDAPAEMCD